MNLTPSENDALVRLARYGAMALGDGSDRVPMSAAVRLSLAGFATLTLRVGEQMVELTRQGMAFSHRVVR